MLHRLLYPWNLPPYGLPNPGAFDWQPASLAEGSVLLPDGVQDEVQHVEWERMFDFSCKVARHLRRLGVRFEESAMPHGAVLIASDHHSVSTAATAHAFLMSLAQRAAIEMAGLMTSNSEPAMAAIAHSEICGVAFLAESSRRIDGPRRLSETLRLVAHQTTGYCAADRLAGPIVQFSHSRPSGIRSPLAGGGTIPVAGYRIQFAGCGTASVLQALADALQALPSGHRSRGRADVLVLSNLWAPAAG